MSRRPPTSPLFPYTTLFRSVVGIRGGAPEALLQEGGCPVLELLGVGLEVVSELLVVGPVSAELGAGNPPDRKSTRLNSSHVSISYAVFCLKKKTRARGRAAS